MGWRDLVGVLIAISIVVVICAWAAISIRRVWDKPAKVDTDVVRFPEVTPQCTTRGCLLCDPEHHPMDHKTETEEK